MAQFFLSYDLRESRDYQPLHAELKKFGAVRILESIWSFNCLNASAETLLTHFKNFIDNDDGLVMSEVIDWATDGSPNDPP